MSEPIIHFTDQAIEHIKKSLVRFPGGGFRLGVKKAGCSGYKYIPEVVAAPKAEDIHFAAAPDLQVFVDSRSVEMLRGTWVDYTAKGLGQKQLVFKNPNATDACGCGESFHWQGDEQGNV